MDPSCCPRRAREYVISHFLLHASRIYEIGYSGQDGDRADKTEIDSGRSISKPWRLSRQRGSRRNALLTLAQGRVQHELHMWSSHGSGIWQLLHLTEAFRVVI